MYVHYQTTRGKSLNIKVIVNSGYPGKIKSSFSQVILEQIHELHVVQGMIIFQRHIKNFMMLSKLNNHPYFSHSFHAMLYF